MTPPENRKSCDPQLLTRPPDSTWGVADLGDYARAQSRAIDDGDRTLTACYWRLGLALQLARQQFAHRQWGRYLHELRIDKTRAAKARAIHATFASEQLVAGLTVQEAYRQRLRKPRAARPRRTTSNPNAPLDFLLGACEQAESIADEAEFAGAERAAKLLTMIDTAIAELEKLRRLVRSRLGA